MHQNYFISYKKVVHFLLHSLQILEMLSILTPSHPLES